MTEYSKKTFDDAIHTWEQLIGVKSLEQAIEIQSQYAKRVYENHIAEIEPNSVRCIPTWCAMPLSQLNRQNGSPRLVML